jgi:hypothetical protein
MPSVYVRYDLGSHDSKVIPLTLFSQGRPAANHDLLVLEHFGGGNLQVWDDANQVDVLLAPDNDKASVAGDSVLFLHFGAITQPHGWIWTRPAASPQALVVPANGTVVADIRSDTQQLVWIQVPEPSANDTNWPPGELWASPFATSSAGLSPAKVADVPSYGNSAAVGGGYYAMFDIVDKDIHVIRLSDGAQASFAPPSQPAPFRAIAHVDDQAVWYEMAGGVFRRKLADLGL